MFVQFLRGVSGQDVRWWMRLHDSLSLYITSTYNRTQPWLGGTCFGPHQIDTWAALVGRTQERLWGSIIIIFIALPPAAARIARSGRPRVWRPHVWDQKNEEMKTFPHIGVCQREQYQFWEWIGADPSDWWSDGVVCVCVCVCKGHRSVNVDILKCGTLEMTGICRGLMF